MVTKSIVVNGKVQGVFFRKSCREKAITLGINGWAKNLPNGDVAITATGNATAIRDFILWCHRGPANAVVTQVMVTEVALTFFIDFTIERF